MQRYSARLNIGPSHPLLPYFVYASRKESGMTALTKYPLIASTKGQTHFNIVSLDYCR